jgi:hypothetical protein
MKLEGKTIERACERFNDNYMPVPESGCWLWTGTINDGRYGALSLCGKPISAHRLSWLLHHGDIPQGKFVLHKCDVKSCVNPDHLFIGTAKDNTADMLKKKRHRTTRGSDRHNAKLSDMDVHNIRFLRGMRVKCKDIAEFYDVGRRTISSIATRRYWAWLN